MSARIEPCFNCHRKPTIHKQTGRYPFRMDPPTGYGCLGRFHLESHQKTREACIADWNRHQRQFTRTQEPK